MTTFHMRLLLFAECMVIFIGLPLLILLFKDRALMLTMLWTGSAIAASYLAYHGQLRWKIAVPYAGIRHVLLRFMLLAPIIALLTWLMEPENFLSFPREQPGRWLMVIILYPLLSVWPQEIVYRAFLFHRYQPLFGQGRGYVIASALLFGFMHIIFLNWIAVVMTVIGGFLFASDYARHRSLLLACLEHALYGGLIFTLGLGIHFYSNAAWGLR